MSSDLPRERVWRSLHALACGDGDLADRVASAHISGISSLNERDFPEDLAPLFASLRAAISRAKDCSVEEDFEAAVANMEPEDIKKYAETVLRLYTRIVEIDGPLGA